VTEREWREASDMRVSFVNLLIVLAVALGLRLWGIGAGIPYAIGVDEPEIIERVVTMMKSGNFNPRFFDYPGLIFYLHLVVAIARFMVGALGGAWTSLDQVSGADFYLWGRVFTALLGVGTVYLIYLAGQRWGARHALLAAGLLAVAPMHVRESHYALTDVPVTFFCTLTFLLSLAAHEKADARAFARAGVAAGLTIGTKYNAGIVLLLPLVAAWMTLEARPSRLRCALAALGAAVGTFLLVAPYTVLDLPGFLNGFAHLVGYYQPRPANAESGWIVYLKHLRLTLGWVASALLAAGLILGIVRAIKGPGRVRWTLLVLFPIVYFATIGGRSLIFGRYLLPLLPYACLLAAIAVVSGVSLLRRFDIPHLPRRVLITALTIAALLQPLIGAVGFARRVAAETTQDVAYRFIQSRIPDGSRIVLEKFGLRLPPRWRTEHVRQLTELRLEDYQRKRVDYLVATSEMFGPAFQSPQQMPAVYTAYRTLFDQSEAVLTVKPEPGRSGPEIRIYRLPRPAPAAPPAPPAATEAAPRR
jgi:4-amino-4-deoxy-L-arabinose transferase-like glycosyltransferase